MCDTGEEDEKKEQSRGDERNQRGAVAGRRGGLECWCMGEGQRNVLRTNGREGEEEAQAGAERAKNLFSAENLEENPPE